MYFLTRFSLRKAPIVFMLMVLVVFGGWVATQQLKSELLPNIDLPVLSVVTVYPGAAPDDVRRDVTEPVEKILAGSANLKSVSSTSSDSVSFVTAQYEYGTNMEKTQQTIQEAVNRLTMPAQVQRPNVGRFNFQDIPVVAFTINTQAGGADALANLRREVEDKIVPELKAINGVNSVTVAGGGEKQVVITFDAAKLRKNGLTASQITGILQANNISFPTGQVVDNGQSIPVRVGNQFNTVEDLRDLVVRPEIAAQAGGGQGAGAAGGQGSGQGAGGQTQPAGPSPAVTLGEVATVELSNATGNTISRSNGKPSLSVVVYKTQNSNTIQVADAVNARMDEAIKTLPGSQKAILVDQSTFIKESLDGLIREGVLGALLAIVVILVFLTNLRSTIITAVSIPLSVLIALILMNTLSISLNIMSLAGLAVAIGRVVDDSIVVLENIYRHHFQEGESLRDAAFNGTKEVATAITSSTITTVCVFLPLGFIAGLVSEFFRPFAVAVTVSLLASLVVALTVIPVLAVILLKTGRAKDPGKAAAAHVAPRDTWVQRLYTPTIRFVLRNGWTKLGTIAVALLLFAGSMAIPALGLIGTTFINIGSDKVLHVAVNLSPGSDIQTTSDVAQSIEAELQKLGQVQNYQVNIGSNAEAAASGFVALGSSSTADFTVNYDRSVDINAEAEHMRTLLDKLGPDSKIESYNVTPGIGGGFNSSAFAAVVSGSDYQQVLKASDSLVNRLKAIPDLVNVTSDAARAKPEIRVQVDPAKALAHGTTAAQIAQQVRNLLTKQDVTSITIDGRLYDVEATYDQATLNDIEAIKGILVGTVNPVALSEVAQVTRGDGPVSITRVDQERAVTVRGTINSDSTSGVTNEAQKAIDSVKAEAGGDLSITLGGVSQQQSESFGQMGVALVVAIILVYMVMVLTFGSLSTPFIIMFSLPLAAIGSIVALYVTDRPLGISALIGVLMLVGIVVTNAIVLLDLVEQLKHRGLSTYEALVQGGRTRVRPIIMTAVATMIALMPLVLGFSEGSIIASELGTVVVGGLFTSTLLTLLVVPVAYSLLDGLRSRFSRRTPEAEAEDVTPVRKVEATAIRTRKSPFMKPNASPES
ncbi:MAG: hydrophobic/amphiphilic exporter (mainly bacteria), family [Chloroflexia bacterium]|jgi:HAE1 family hydrophobic/amphiphilic exporter-1|nr:hydrophobic/amphiphilic exporter (mainly bacteria), family [Chloroflexia bacterium]